MFTVKCWVLIVGGSLSTLFKLCSNLLDKLDKPYAFLVREHCIWLGVSYMKSCRIITVALPYILNVK